ncbi:hypothetical protein BaRGS_00020664 [Batillaria attramentaria]|uniref:Copper transport protein n=1 Tax=Batillaria attramentaria TaxID=370345 RepID=A0ABD0KM21_9CAEN
MMYFHAGSTEYILFKDLCTNSDGAFAGACIAVFVLAILYELLKFWREQLQRQYIFRVAHIMREGTPEEKGQITSAVYRMMSGPHLLQTILHAVQIFISYCLMLIFMTYNAYLALCVVLGAAFGYFLVGWKRTQITDSNEHCH